MRFVKKRLFLLMIILVLVMDFTPSVPFIECSARSEEGEGISGERSSRSVYTATGQIERITGNEVVMGDSLMKFSSSVSFKSSGGKKGKKISRSRFRPGTRVGFSVNSEDEITSMWLIK
ncbi:MAG: hypothetical protein SV775_01115 [Thermodesulfobacteriota bacterium]|nr:hypothetical protein [Thermodesulfobacteriota bacterium]